jgi:hypothetical protein
MPKITVHGGPSNAFIEDEDVPVADKVQVIYNGEIYLVDPSALSNPKRREAPVTTYADDDTTEDDAEAPQAAAEATNDPDWYVTQGETGSDADTASEAVPYDQWTKAELTAELELRNKERVEQGVDPLPTTGNKAELIARLEQDDSEQVEE